MFNVCPQCGAYSAETSIEKGDSTTVAICPTCGHAQPFLQLPLFIITGASGAGKTTICLELALMLRGQCVVLESDILWGAVPATREDDYRGYRNVWLRLAKDIGQSGVPVVLCGTAVPHQFEPCPERGYFSTLHYLALVCDDGILRERLMSRPVWRQSHSASFVEQMVTFNHWLQEHAATTIPPLALHDTTRCGVDEFAKAAVQWIRERLLAVGGT